METFASQKYCKSKEGPILLSITSLKGKLEPSTSLQAPLPAKYKGPCTSSASGCRKAEVSQAFLSHKEWPRAANDQENRVRDSVSDAPS